MDGRVDEREEVVGNDRAVIVQRPDQKKRGSLVIRDREPFPKKLRNDTKTDVVSDFSTRDVFDQGYDLFFDTPRKHRAAEDQDGETMIGQVLRYLSRDVCHGADIKSSLWIAGRTNANDKDVRVSNRAPRVRRDTQQTGLGSRLEKFRESGFLERRDSASDLCRLCRIWIHANDRVTRLGETRGGDTPNVPETENSDVHLCPFVCGDPLKTFYHFSARVSSVNPRAYDLHVHVLYIGR